MIQASARDPASISSGALGMFIILIAHVPWDPWAEWIPARFGFSDAADLFVFCSRPCLRAFRVRACLPAARLVARRCARGSSRVAGLYWAHIGGFVVVCRHRGGGRFQFGDGRYAGHASRAVFCGFQAYAPRTADARYIPAYFDILPMYLAILAMIPVVMALAKFDRRLVLSSSSVPGRRAISVLSTWSLTHTPVANGFSIRSAGKVLFFTGFCAFARGWLPPPPRSAADGGRHRHGHSRRAGLLPGRFHLLCRLRYGALARGHSRLAGSGDRQDPCRRAALCAFHSHSLSCLPHGRTDGCNLRGWLARLFAVSGSRRSRYSHRPGRSRPILGMILDHVGRGFSPLRSSMASALRS